MFRLIRLEELQMSIGNKKELTKIMLEVLVRNDLLALSKEHDDKGLCAWLLKKYQDIKLEELEAKKDEISSTEFEKIKNKITDKSCLCVGLVNAAYLENDIQIKGQQQGIVICPGPNLAYFDREISLADMVKTYLWKCQCDDRCQSSKCFCKRVKNVC